MTKTEKRSGNKWIWLVVLILVTAVCVTAFLLANRWLGFLPDDSGAIDLVYGLEVSADDGVWDTGADLSIFRVSYENGQRQVFALSSDGDKIIAPGTSNTYVFKLKNNGVVPMDYKLELDAVVTPGDVSLPIISRIMRHDGVWVLGGEEAYMDTAALDSVLDTGTLGIGKFVRYTLDWQWLFDNDNDLLDTLLGNVPKDEAVTLTIRLRATSRESKDASCDIGMLSPHSCGFNLTFWVIVTVTAMLALVIMLLLDNGRRIKDRTEEQE